MNICNISNVRQLDIVQSHSEIDSDDQKEKEETIAQVLELSKTIKGIYD
jgi:hypothetical protein